MPRPRVWRCAVYLSVEISLQKRWPRGQLPAQPGGRHHRRALYPGRGPRRPVRRGKPVRCGSFAAPLYGENAADASAFTLNLSAGRGAMLHCFCEVPDNWETLELTYQPAFAASQPMTFVVRRGADEVQLGPVPASPAEVGSVVDL